MRKCNNMEQSQQIKQIKLNLRHATEAIKGLPRGKDKFKMMGVIVALKQDLYDLTEGEPVKTVRSRKEKVCKNLQITPLLDTGKFHISKSKSKLKPISNHKLNKLREKNKIKFA